MRMLPDYPSVRFCSLSPLPPHFVLLLQTHLLSNFPVQPSLVSRLTLPSISLRHTMSMSISTPFACSPHRWAMPAFIPKQKRQALVCECSVLLPRHFLCNIHQHRPPVLTGSMILPYIQNPFVLMPCVLFVNAMLTTVLIAVQQQPGITSEANIWYVTLIFHSEPCY
jgi:hypothetical protein